MAAAAVLEFQRAQSLLSTDREASIGILHSIGEPAPPAPARPPAPGRPPLLPARQRRRLLTHRASRTAARPVPAPPAPARPAPPRRVLLPRRGLLAAGEGPELPGAAGSGAERAAATEPRSGSPSAEPRGSGRLLLPAQRGFPWGRAEAAA